jgi:hypothetical protein
LSRWTTSPFRLPPWSSPISDRTSRQPHADLEGKQNPPGWAGGPGVGWCLPSFQISAN